MILYDNELYVEDIFYVANLDLPWKLLQDKSIVLSGATGLIGSFFVDVILEKNKMSGLNCKIYALVRSLDKANARFCKYINDKNLVFIQYDVKEALNDNRIRRADYILHLASNTHPFLYATDPIGTITTNIIGVQNLLEFAVNNDTKRFLFASSNEIYGENRGDVELFEEKYCGYIDCNSLRADYPESKRCGEALCQAYNYQKGIDTVVARFTRTFGPTMSFSDTKAICQFIIKGVKNEDIVLKSDGKQFYSYLYVSDAVSGLLTILLSGNNRDAYNISDISCDIRLKDLANLVARVSGNKVVHLESDEVEASGYSKVTKARLDGSKLRSLGWNPQYSIEQGVERTISILRSII